MKIPSGVGGIQLAKTVALYILMAGGLGIFLGCLNLPTYWAPCRERTGHRGNRRVYP